VVAAHAGRLFNLTLGSFHELAQSLRLMYADPDRSKLPGEACQVTAAVERGVED
jgi:hypothetical protein